MRAETRLRNCVHRSLPIDLAANVPHFLIAHSHGGNIALYALCDPAAEERSYRGCRSVDSFSGREEEGLRESGPDLLLHRIPGLGLAGRRAHSPSHLAERGVAPGNRGNRRLHVVDRACRPASASGRDDREGSATADLAPERLWIARMTGDEATSSLQTGSLPEPSWRRYSCFSSGPTWAEKIGDSSLRISCLANGGRDGNRPLVLAFGSSFGWTWVGSGALELHHRERHRWLILLWGLCPVASGACSLCRRARGTIGFRSLDSPRPAFRPRARHV